jgi:hypothetical protein
VQVKAETILCGFVQIFNFDKSILELVVKLGAADERGHFE